MSRDRSEFNRKTRQLALDRAAGHCEVCTTPLATGKYIFDHRLPDALGGTNTLENCIVQCKACDAPKTKADIQRIRKADRQRAHYAGTKTPSRTPMPFGRFSKWKRKMNGDIVERH